MTVYTIYLFVIFLQEKQAKADFDGSFPVIFLCLIWVSSGQRLIFHSIYTPLNTGSASDTFIII